MLQALPPQKTIRNDVRRRPVGRFWETARGFWLGSARGKAWLLTAALVVLIFVQLGVQYRLNVWNRDFFDAIAQKNGDRLITQALVFAPLAAAAVGLAVLAVYGRMTMQREWRGREAARRAFARLLLRRPDLVIMDEATSALDVASQTHLMNMVIERLPAAAIVSIAHRSELEAFHDRKLVFEHRADGSHLA